MGKIRIAVLALFVALSFAGTAAAGVTSTNLNVTATVVPWCTISVGAIAFGDYDGNASSVPMNVNVKCTNTTPYNVSMDAGQNYGSGWRHMSDGAGQLLRYYLIRASGGEWSDVGFGDTYPYGGPVPGTGNGGFVNLGGTAFTFSGWAPTPGGYSDVVIAAVNF